MLLPWIRATLSLPVPRSAIFHPGSHALAASVNFIACVFVQLPLILLLFDIFSSEARETIIMHHVRCSDITTIIPLPTKLHASAPPNPNSPPALHSPPRPTSPPPISTSTTPSSHSNLASSPTTEMTTSSPARPALSRPSGYCASTPGVQLVPHSLTHFTTVPPPPPSAKEFGDPLQPAGLRTGL